MIYVVYVVSKHPFYGLPHQVRDPAGENPSFSRPGPGHDPHRPNVGKHGFPLGVVQLGVRRRLRLLQPPGEIMILLGEDGAHIAPAAAAAAAIGHATERSNGKGGASAYSAAAAAAADARIQAAFPAASVMISRQAVQPISPGRGEGLPPTAAGGAGAQQGQPEPVALPVLLLLLLLLLWTSRAGRPTPPLLACGYRAPAAGSSGAARAAAAEPPPTGRVGESGQVAGGEGPPERRRRCGDGHLEDHRERTHGKR